MPEVLRPLYESSAVLAQKTTIAVSLILSKSFWYITVAVQFDGLINWSLLSFFIWQALRHLRQLSQEASGDIAPRNGQKPAALRALSQRLARYVIGKPKEFKRHEFLNQASVSDVKE